MNYNKFLKENNIETIQKIVETDLTINKQLLFCFICENGHLNIAQ